MMLDAIREWDHPALLLDGIELDRAEVVKER